MIVPENQSEQRVGFGRLLDRDLAVDGARPVFDIAPDGKRFAVFPRPESEEKQGNVHVTFLLNFFDELRRKVPVAK